MKKENETIEMIVNKILSSMDLGLGQDNSAGRPYAANLNNKGIFENVNDAVEAVSQARIELEHLSLEKRREIIEAIREKSRENVEMLARMEIEETGYGRYEHKVIKHLWAINGTPGIEDIRPEVFTGDHGITLILRRPFGVAACIVPSTAPSATVIHNSICMIAAGNGAVISPHPGAKNTTLKAVELINEAIEEAGGPKNLIVAVREASIEKASEIMAHPKVRLLLATGGPGVVKAVLSSGKKAIGAGPGNPPALVDETADIPKAARDIIAGCGMENCTNCIGEKEVLVVEQVADQLIEEMAKNDAYLLKDPNVITKLTRLVTTTDGAVNKDYIGKDASIILKAIGIIAPEETKVIMFEAPSDHIIVTNEYLMPVLPIVRIKDIDEGIKLAVDIEGGRRHSAVIHSTNISNMNRFAQAIQTTIFTKNGSSFNGAGLNGEGYMTMSIAGPTGEGLTTPRSFTRPQRCALIEEIEEII